jgi:hypothetical protein
MTLDLPLTFDSASHTYAVGDLELPSVTRILAEARLQDFSAPWFTDEVKERGQHVHAAIALDNEGALDEDTLDPVLVPYVAGWRRYLEESGATLEHFEQPVCDRAVGYAGTLDAIVLEPGQRGPTRRTLLDIKPALYPSVGPQTAAYARCARQLYDTPVLFQRAALLLPGDGTYRREPLTDASDEMTFLAAVRIFHWRSKHGLAA